MKCLSNFMLGKMFQLSYIYWIIIIYKHTKHITIDKYNLI